MSNMSNKQAATTLPVYLFATVEEQELNSVLGKMKEVSYVNWFGSTSGRFDFVATFKGNDVAKIDAAISEIRSIKGVVSADTMFPLEGESDLGPEEARFAHKPNVPAASKSRVSHVQFLRDEISGTFELESI
jgi:DNA-binding Lrp family transcriptional regulator